MNVIPNFRRPLLSRPRLRLFPSLRIASVQARRKVNLAALAAYGQEPPPPNKQVRRPVERPIPFHMRPKPVLTLTPDEEKLRSLLLDVVGYIYENRADHRTKPLVLRFTGGWVRDKVMGIESHDIDVAINKMTGYEFGLNLSKYLAANQDKWDIPPGHIHKIESNPEKSKHLETATTKILGLHVDLVNLRSEVYDSDSRIPQMEFGTPTQDAMRRDCTINALFYNLTTREIEDHTHKGLQDIDEQKIRTPLEPYRTFEDDPLRVLRLIRFSCKFNFEILMEAVYAIEHPGIQRALALKVSRERIYSELEKMLNGPRPHLALSQIHHFGLYSSVFTPPPTTPSTLREMRSIHMYHAACCLQYLLTHEEAPETFPKIRSLLNTPEERYLAWMCAAFTPWSARNVGYLVDSKGNAPAAMAAKEALKCSNKIVGSLNVAFRNGKLLEEAVDENSRQPLNRTEMGMLIRRVGADWKIAVICSLLLSVIRSSELYELKPNDKSMAKLHEYECFIQTIERLNVSEAYTFKSILTGNELANALSAPSGIWMASALNKLMEWQLSHADATKAEAVAWVKENEQALMVVEGQNEKIKVKEKGKQQSGNLIIRRTPSGPGMW